MTTTNIIDNGNEGSNWEDSIYKIQDTDLVNADNANKQATQLLHRINFLKNATTGVFTQQKLEGNGYQRLPGGLLLQWCYGPNSTDSVKESPFTVSFPTPFAQCFGVQVSTYNIQDVTNTNPSYLNDNNAIYQVIRHDASAVTLMLQVMAGADNSYTDRYKPFIFALGM